MAEVEPQLPLSAVRPIDAVRSAALGRQRMLMTLVGLLAGAALLLAAIGIQGLIASGVAERTRELGIRIALGATVAQTVRDAALPGLLRNVLWDVKANDPLTFVTVVAALLVVAVAASVLPALRVRRPDPVALLRCE